MQPKRKKAFLQRLSAVLSILCFTLCAICTVLLMVYFGDFSKVYKASFASTAFFFFTVGIVLKEIADTDLPVYQTKSTAE